MEMTSFAMERRFVAQGGIPLRKLKDPSSMTAAEKKLALQRIDTLRKLDYTIHAGTATVESIRARQNRDNNDIILVDHLHRMSTDMAQIEKNIRGLKNIALDTNCVVVVLAQVSRVELNERPPINKLRGSGMIEAEADQVLMLWRQRDELGQRNPDGVSEIYVAKMRDDEVDYSIPLRFDSKSLTFKDTEAGFQHPVVEACDE